MVSSSSSGQYLRLETPATPQMQRNDHERSSCCAMCCSCLGKLLGCWKGSRTDASDDEDSFTGGRHERMSQYRAPTVTPPPRAGSGSSLSDCDHEQGTLLPKRPTPEPGTMSGAGTSTSAAVAAANAAETTAAAAGSMEQDVPRHHRTGSGAHSNPSWDTGSPERSHNAAAVSCKAAGGSSKLVKGGLGGSSPSLADMESGGVGTAMLLGGEDQDDDDCCPTCLEVYTTDNPRIWTRCGHHFHMQCIYAWSERKETCPLCESHILFD